MPPSAAAGYRPDVDGLRAVAVLSVILYHLGFERFRGGYVGVDVFFVISGFLITRLIREQVEGERFSLRTFYVRRIRRLLPALLATSVASLLVGVVLLSPERLQELARSVVYASVSLSNWFFYRNSDYFAAEATSRPMLHTWSLSVEEQFYLVWPTLLLVLLSSRIRRWAPFALAAIGVASLAMTRHFATNTAAVFYLTPFRVFEFATGAVTVWLDSETAPPNWVREGGLWIGLALVVAAVVGVGTRTFSDVGLLAPCIGAALVIYCGTARASGIVLRNRVAVAIGLISYSMYLVHWPLIVFYDYWKFEPLTAADRALLIVATLVLATLLYHGVEKRFRLRSASAPRSNRTFLLAYAASLVVVVATAEHIGRHGGWPWRFPAAVQRQINSAAIDADKQYTWRAFHAAEHPFASDGRERVLLIGDSQGADVANMLVATGETARVDFRTIEADMQCQALISFHRAQFDALNAADRAWCSKYQPQLDDSVSIARAADVILAFNWDRRGVPFIADAVAALERWGVRRVYVVGRKSQGAGGPELVVRYGLGSDLEARSAERKNPIAWDADARITALRSPFTYVDLMAQLCPSADRCHVVTRTGDVILFDGSHFTPAGARYVGGLLMRTHPFDF